MFAMVGVIKAHPFYISVPLDSVFYYIVKKLRFQFIRLVEDELLKSLLFKPNVICELNSNRATLAMVLKGAGIAFVPIPYAQGVKNIRIFRLDPALYRSNFLVCRKSQGSFEPEKFLVELIKGYPLFHLENTD